jgi:hypothetical protein
MGNKTGNARMKATSRRVHLTVAAVEQQLVLYILSVCFSLVIQHAMRIRHIVLLSVAFPTLSTIFRIIYKNSAIFGKSC